MIDRENDEWRPCRLETSLGQGTVSIWPAYWRSQANGDGTVRGIGLELTEARRLLAALPEAIAHAEAENPNDEAGDRAWVLEDEH